mmetsp:Transcript_117636/g.365650  ORF Transcript_117636/g.365650 Transcript_117636/m.365650 type:complete len:311 (+) Transcript_117636:648-1580(+)
MGHVLLQDDDLAVVRLPCHLPADLDGLRQLRERFLEAAPPLPALHVQGLPREAELGNTLGDAALRRWLVPEPGLVPLEVLQRGEAALSCLRAAPLHEHPGDGHSGRHPQVRHDGHGVRPALRRELLVEAGGVREARGQPGPLHGLHEPEERLLVYQGSAVVLARLHRGDAVLFERRGVEEVHGAGPLGAPRGVAGPEDQVRRVGELHEVARVLDVDAPELVAAAEPRDHGHVQEGLDEEVRDGAAGVAPLRRGHDAVDAAPAEGDDRQLRPEARQRELPGRAGGRRRLRGAPHVHRAVPLCPGLLLGRGR